MKRIKTSKAFDPQWDSACRHRKKIGIFWCLDEAADVPKMMLKLFSWTKNALINNASPLIIAALFHYYFVTIHPFMDGNGVFLGFLLISF